MGTLAFVLNELNLAFLNQFGWNKLMMIEFFLDEGDDDGLPPKGGLSIDAASSLAALMRSFLFYNRECSVYSLKQQSEHWELSMVHAYHFLTKASGLPTNLVTAWLRSVSEATEFFETNGSVFLERYLAELSAVHIRIWGEAITSYAQAWEVWQGEVTQLERTPSTTPLWQKQQLDGPKVVSLFKAS